MTGDCDFSQLRSNYMVILNSDKGSWVKVSLTPRLNFLTNIGSLTVRLK